MIHKYSLLIIFLFIPAQGMRIQHPGARLQIVKQAVKPLAIAHHSRTAAVINQKFIRSYSTEYETQAEAKRQETWLRMKRDVAERVNELKAKGAKHRAQVATHTRYARIYETLAELENDKFELFELTIDKLNESAKYFEEPSLEAETKLLQALHETYEEFYNALPPEEKF